MRNEKPRGAAVLRRKIFVIKPERDPRLLVHKIFQRQVRGVVAVRTHHGVLSIRFYVCKQSVERYAFPSCPELRPSCNAVYVDRDGLGGQFAERLPIPSPQNVRAVVDRKFPLVERDMWSGACGQDGKVSREVLPGR